jgi:glucokinase
VTTLAVDIGGTKIEVGIVDDFGSILVRRRAATPGSGLADLIVALCVDVRSEAAAQFIDAPGRVGVGCGGPMAGARGEVSPLNIPEWRGFRLRDHLRTSLGLEVVVDNDAKALALAEGWLGAAQGERNYLAMVVSTGVGAGIVVDGQLLDGADGNAGHLGHLMVDSDGPRCACGSVGCLESLASGLSIEAATGRPAAEASAGLRRQTGTLVGRAVAQAVVLLDLRLALVGGSVALGFGAPFFEAANAELQRCARIEYASGARIEPVGLGSDAPLVGAAAVARG